MILFEYPKHSTFSDKVAKLYLPMEDVPLDLRQPLTEVEHEGRMRRVSTAIVGIVRLFNARGQILRRSLLRHDCGVFAYSCQTGEMFEDEPFYFPGKRYVDRDWSHDDLVVLDGDHKVPSTEVGDVLMTMRLDDDGELLAGTHHFMVRASEEDGFEPLYASKLTRMGAAVLHTFDESLNYFPADAVVPAQLRLFVPEIEA